ncbi:MAG: response regulator transcription factor [Chloroflexi bacterium]|nr:response regulator transcription factor [Chloroflexota bacterium]
METDRAMIRILIADDHTLVRQGIRMLLEAQPDVQVVGEASDGAEAVRLTREQKPDVVVMDIAMPGMDGLEATLEIKRAQPETQILALTMHEGEDYFFKILSAGASGYVLKRAASTDLIAAVHAVTRGEVFLYPSVAKKLVVDYLSRVQGAVPEERAASFGLTPRESEVVELVAEGLTNREIAEKLTVSLSTVQTHYAHIIEKLKLHSRTELVKYAIRHGLIKASD